MYYESTYLAHHGIKGQKWGIRRFQNEDGTRTSAGKRRLKMEASLNRSQNPSARALTKAQKKYDVTYDVTTGSYSLKDKPQSGNEKWKTALKIGAAAVGTAAVAYGAYKMYQLHDDNIKIGKHLLAQAKYTDFVTNVRPDMERRRGEAMDSAIANYKRAEDRGYSDHAGRWFKEMGDRDMSVVGNLWDAEREYAKSVSDAVRQTRENAESALKRQDKRRQRKKKIVSAFRRR